MLNVNTCTQLMNKHFKLSQSGTLKLSLKLYCVSTKCQKSQSQWARILRCETATTRLLRLQVRIQWRDGCLSFMSVVCCQVVVSAVGQSLVQSSPTGVVCLRWGLHKATLYTTHQ